MQQQQQYPGMWQQYPPVPGYPQPPLPRQGMAPPLPGAPAQPPLPGARPPVPGQPPLPGAKPPTKPTISVSGKPPPPPPPDQPPPPPGSDTIPAPTPPQPQPPAPSANAPVAKPNNNNPNVNKLNLSAPPPPPPPEEDKHSKPPINKFPNQKGRGSQRNNFNKSQSKPVIRGSGGWRGNGRRFQNNSYQDDTEYDDNYCDQNYDDGYNETDYDQGYGDMDLENDDNAQNNEYNEYNDYNDQDQNFNQAQDWRGNFGKSTQERFNNETSSVSAIRPGDWKCGDEDCGEINFARREECRKCRKSKHFQKFNAKNTERKCDNGNAALANFDKMYKNWESTYEKWKDENKTNPDEGYIQSYSAQMEAMKSQLLDKRKKIVNSQAMVEKWNSESGTVDVHNPFISPKKSADTEADKAKENNKSEAFESLAAANECVMKILEDNDYGEDSDDEKKVENEKNNVKRSRWADPEPEMKNKKSRWGDANEKNSGNEQRQQQTRWGEDNEVPSKKSRWDSNDDGDDININDMRRRPNNLQPPSGGFQPRPGGFQPRMNSFQGRPFLNQNNQHMSQLRGRGSLLGGPPRGFASRGFGSFRGRGGQFQRPPVQDNFENFWNPAEVKDYSQKQSNNFNAEPDFRPQTFDYSHGIKSGNIGNNGHHRGRGGQFSSLGRDLGVKMSGNI